MTRPLDPLQTDSPGGGIFGRPSEVVGVVWFTLLFVLSIGLSNGDSNQNSYLLLGLRLADPNFLPGDWFTWDTVHAHQSYGVLIAAMARLGFLHLGLSIGTVVQNTVFALSFFVLLRGLYDRPLLPWAAALALFSSMDTLSLGDAPWLRPFLGVSSMAGVAMFVGIAFLAHRRLLSAGIALGFSAMFHAHFLVLCLPILSVLSVELIFERERGMPLRELARLWIPFLLLGAPAAFLIVEFAAAPGAEEIRWLTPAVFPYHVSPWTWQRDPVLLLVGVILLGLGGMALRPPRSNRPLLLVWLAVIAAVGGSLLLAYPRLFEPAARAWPWRLSPLLVVAGLATGMAAVVSTQGVAQLTRSRHHEVGLGLLLTGAVIIAGLSRPPVSYALLIVCSAPIVIGLGRLASHRWEWTPSLSRLLSALVITAAFTPMILEAADRFHYGFEPERSERAELYEWVREQTPEHAIFAIPPSWEGFRLNARRPIVVDWKGIPRFPPDRIEWLERIRAVTGVERPGGDRRELDRAYERMDCDRALTLRSRYGVRFVIREQVETMQCGQLVYEDDHFRVWDLGPRDLTTR